MKYFSKEQINELKALDVIKHFDTAIDSNYKRGTTRDIIVRVADIYDEATGNKVTRNFNCGSCVLNLFKTAGKLYRESVLYHKQEQMRKAREAKKKKDEEKQEK